MPLQDPPPREDAPISAPVVPDKLDYDSLEPIEIPVFYKKKTYILREVSEGGYGDYQNAIFKSFRVNEAGRPIPGEGMSESDTLLVSKCLYQADEQGHLRVSANGDPDPRWLVGLAVLKSWPRRVVKDLYQQVRTISGMDERRSPEEIKKELLKLQRDYDELAGTNGKPSAADEPAKNLLGATTGY